MIRSIDGMIVKNGNLIRGGIARKSTLLRALDAVPTAELHRYQVTYRDDGRRVRQPAREFIADCLDVWRDR